MYLKFLRIFIKMKLSMLQLISLIIKMLIVKWIFNLSCCPDKEREHITSHIIFHYIFLSFGQQDYVSESCSAHLRAEVLCYYCLFAFTFYNFHIVSDFEGNWARFIRVQMWPCSFFSWVELHLLFILLFSLYFIFLPVQIFLVSFKFMSL